eukprot:CAMPEP_0117517614 /NCGR_PEP_ID=MMETSP0784-20121206/31704_1 /TAXON_ID=39447 /ORGANISM="" /LENGTH=496 /DNA_ID=CAMNT_0005313503 /DNA_START=47 /DNA_END=1537 /DNA_ORIENTATION=-
MANHGDFEQLAALMRGSSHQNIMQGHPFAQILPPGFPAVGGSDYLTQVVQPVSSPDAPQTAAEAEEPEVQKCHLHRKVSKSCKFCKAYALWVERQEKKREDTKHAALEKLKSNIGSGRNLSLADKAPVSNFSHFPRVLAERIQKTDVYIKARDGMQLPELMDILSKSDSCDAERKNKITLDLQPSPFICVVYHLLAVRVTEGDLAWMTKHDSCWIRCAAMLYVRLGFHSDRYWDCLADSLMDDEDFIPFTSRIGESSTMTVGQYAENLLMKADYGESDTKFPMPRIPVATRTRICRRICLYPQFRKRYIANLQVTDRFSEGGVEVEVCSVDGEWRRAVTRGSQSRLWDQRCASALVVYPDSEEEYVSMGRLIVPDGSSSSSSDLTRSRGKSAQELFEKYNEHQRDSAVARGKDYCKPTVQTVCVGGVRFLAGEKRGRSDRTAERDTDVLEEEEARARRQQQARAEKQAKLAAIESKYCAKVPAKESGHVPDRMRLG